MPPDLSNFERTCTIALALSAEPLNRSNWARWLTQLDVRMPSPPASAKKAKRAAQRTAAGGRRPAATDLTAVAQRARTLLIEPDADREVYAVSAAAFCPLLSDESSRPILEQFAATLSPDAAPEDRIMPSYSEWERWYQAQIARARLLLFRGETAETDAILAVIAEHRHRSHYLASKGSPLLDLLPLGVSAQACALLSARSRLSYLQAVQPLWFSTPIVPDPALLPLCLSLQEPAGRELASHVLSLLLLGPGTGDDADAESLLSASPSVAGATEASTAILQARAIAALRQGQLQESRDLIRTALNLSRGPSGNRKPCLSGPLAPLLTLVLASGDAEERAAAALQLQAAKRKRATAEDHRAAQYLLAGQHPFEQHDLPWDATNWQRSLTLLLTISFSGELPATHEHLQRGVHRLAEDLGSRLKKRGFSWLYEQLKGIALALATRDTATTIATGHYPLLELKKAQAPWEHTLEQVELLLADTPQSDSPAAGMNDERLIFLLKLFGEERVPPADNKHGRDKPAHAQPLRLSVEPRLQKRSAKGWTKGRPVALRTLLEQCDKLDYLSAEDKRVVASILVHRGYYGERTYEFGPRLPLCLIGHPRVYPAGAADGPPLEIIAGRPKLEILEASPGLKLVISPSFDSHGIGLAHDAQGRLQVCTTTAAQKQALSLLARVPVIPESGRARLQAILAPLSSHFTVHSQTAAPIVPDMLQVPADPRPVVRLARSADRDSGLLLRVVVQPLGPQGPALTIGQGLSSVSAEIEGVKSQCTRDLVAERTALNSASQTAPELAEAEPVGRAIERFEDCLDLIQRLGTLGDSIVVQWPDGQSVEVLPSLDHSNLRLRLEDGGGFLELSGDLVIDEALVVGLAEILQARPLSPFVPLPDGRFVGLSPDLRQRLSALAKSTQLVPTTRGEKSKTTADGNTALRIPPLALGFVSPWLRELSAHHLAIGDKARARLEQIEAAYRSKPRLPRTFQAELRPYQVEGFRFLCRVCDFGGGAILADDMGLGKTLMALALLCARGRRGPALVVAPMSLKRNWIDEASRFAPNLRMHRVDGGAEDLAKDLCSFDVIVCSYGVMTQQIETWEQVCFGTVVFDEAQALKNPAARRTQAARRILADARIALTGTPVENHLGDLHSVMTILNPGLLGSSKQFEESFGKPIQQQRDLDAAAALRTLIGPFVLRRRKAEVLRELPPRTEITIEVEPDDSERAFTEALRLSALKRLKKQSEGAGASPVSILAEITRLRRAACHPCLADPVAGATVGAAKLDRLMTLVKDLRSEGHRALIFSQFVDFLKLVAEKLDAEALSYQYLDGSTSEEKRAEAVTAFQDGEGDFFLISLKAGGFGLNLTAADYVIHLDPWWNPAVEAQASDRAHRIGQTRPVTIYKLVNTGSIEERVLALHDRKRELAEELLQDAATPSRLNAKALLELLQH